MILADSRTFPDSPYLAVLMKLICFALLLLAPLQTIAQVSLQEKIGQMLMVAYTNSASKDTLLKDISERHLGGVILFRSNLQNPTQMLALTNELQSQVSRYDLFIATDQEGGQVARLGSSNGFTATNSANTTGNYWNSVDSTRFQAARMAGWLESVGINVNLAPVVDVNTFQFSPAIGNMGRSYSPDPVVVTAHSEAFIEEFTSRDIATAVKHFPGHGSARADSHFGFTDITSYWQSYELDPFRDLAASGTLDMVMTGHLMLRTWDEDYPASLSSVAITDKLRGELGFQGVVISDELFMLAIRDNYTFEEAIIQTIRAGTDILLYNTNLRNGTSLVRQVTDVVMQAIAIGELQESRIEEAYRRIINLKVKRNITNVEREMNELPSEIELMQNVPNPFNPVTVIRFTVGTQDLASVPTRLAVYDLLGREIAVLVNEVLPAGEHDVTFNGSMLPSGMYLYRLEANGFAVTKKMMLLK